VSESTLALKFLDAGAVGPYSAFRWPKPRGSRPGKWVRVNGDLDMCKRGIHACTFAQASGWLREECYVIELRDVVSDDGQKLLARSGRLVRRVDSWDQQAMVRFAADCAARVLPAFEKKYPKDDRPRNAIQAARKWARNPSEKNASYAAAAAYAAYYAYGAATDAASYASYAAAATAASCPYDAAAYAYDAAGAATAASYASYAAAATAASYAYDAAADAASYAQERAWQTKRLRHYMKAPEVAT